MVNLAEVCRSVTKQLADKALSTNEATLTPQQVGSVFKCIGKFISYMFKKTQYEWVVSDIFAFGTVLRNNTTGAPIDFIPAHVLQLETQISKSMPARLLQEASCHR